MPKFAANLSFMYTELPFLDRFEAAANDGFKGVEYLFPYAYEAKELAARLKAHGLTQVLFNLPPAGVDAASIDAAWQAGMRGLACLADRTAEFEAGLALALRYAEALECTQLHMMAGLAPAQHNDDYARAAYIKHATIASKFLAISASHASYASKTGVNILIEPINTRDMPGYFLTRQAQAHELIASIGQPNIKVQMDLYHCQIAEGDVATKLRQYLPTGNIAHIQIAGVPERHEPSIGELNYPYLFDLIDKLGYKGWLGCEYKPRLGGQAHGTSAGLAWLKPYL